MKRRPQHEERLLCSWTIDSNSDLILKMRQTNEGESMSLLCPICGSGNRDQARFCRQCGASLQPQRAVACVTAKCSSTKRVYTLVFERTGEGPWVLHRSEASERSEVTPESQQFLLQEVAWDRTQTDLCPYCANRALIQCNSCGRLSCHPGAEKGTMVKCVWCDADGRIEGHIRQLRGKQRL